jgi:hypothetical protein
MVMWHVWSAYIPQQEEGQPSTGSDMVGGDMASSVSVVIDNEHALAWPMWALTRVNDGGGQRWWRLGCGMVVVGGREVIGQCLATIHCQTLQLLLINI